MSVNEHEIRLKINASAAETGAKRWKGALEFIKRALRGLERDTDGVYLNLRKSMNLPAGGTTERALKGQATAAKTAADAVKRLEITAKNAVTSAKGSTAQLVRQFQQLGDVSGIRAAEKALEQYQQRLASSKSPLDVSGAKADFRETVTGLKAEAQAQKMAASAAKVHSAELDRLKGKYDPLYSSSKLYETQLEEIAQAEAAGVLTAQQAANARERAAMSLESGVVSMNKYGQSVRVSSAHMAAATQGVVAQFNDIGVMLASGQNPLLLAMQQGTQLSQTLNGLGGGPGSVLAALKGGFISMLNPVSLLTIGSIAFGAALFQAVTKVLPKTVDLADAMKTLKTSTDAARDAADRIKDGWNGVRSEYGRLTADVMGLVHAQRLLAQTTASNDLQTVRDSLSRDYLPADNHYARRMADIKGQFWELKNTLELTGDQAKRMGRLFEESIQTTDAGQLADIYARIRKELYGVTDGFTDMTPERQALLQDITDAEDAARRLAAATGDVVPGLTRSADEAARLANELLRAKSLQNRSDAVTYGGRGSVNRWNYTPEGPGTRWTMETIAEMERQREKAGKGGAKLASDLDRATQSVTAQGHALEALAEGQFKSEEAARLFGQAMVENGGKLDEETAKVLANIDAQATRNETLRDTPKDLAETVAEGTETALEDSIRKAFSGGKVSAADFVNGIKNQMASVFAKGLAEKFTSMLGLEKLFNVGGTTAAVQMQTAIVTGGTIAAQTMATAIATGNVAAGATSAAGGAGGGNWLTAVGSFFGFSEGGYSDRPGMTKHSVPLSAFQNAPQYAEGTANTSNGIPAILHPNEAVVPLSRGRKIPVELGGAGKGDSRPYVGAINVTVEGGNGEGDAEMATRISQSIEETIIGIVDTRIAENAQYGGALNPRGS